jgi:hypothetical protein
MLLSWDAANELEVSRKAGSNGVGCAAGHFSKSARSGAPPVISVGVKGYTALQFAVKVAHPRPS